jgi:outer membrane protein assembly factor BamB
MRAVLAAVALLWAGAVQAFAGDTLWTSVRGTAAGRGTCRWAAESFPEVREWHFTGRARRRYEPGLAVWASPAVAVVDGEPMAFLGGYDQTMSALNLRTKERVWARITNGAIAAAPAVGLVGGRQVVYWGSADRTVYAAVARDGQPLWTRQLVPATTTLSEARLSAPHLHADVLYITCFAYDRALSRSEQSAWLVALDMRDGRELWRLQVSSGPVSSPVGCAVGRGHRVLVAAQKGLLQAFDVSEEGAVKVWDYQMPHEVLGSPVVLEGTDRPLAFLGSKFGNLIAVDARTGAEVWKRMAGNWIDNTACVGELGGEAVVFTGSHDYKVYAFRARDGEPLWSRALGGEVYSAPCFFDLGGEPAVCAAALDDHLYVLDARTGRVLTSYFTGRPIWDKVAKGDTLWGSPVVLEAGRETAVVHGSFNDTVYVLPLLKECSLRAKVRSAAGLWWGLGVVLALFLGLILPVVLKWPVRGAGGVASR